MAASLQALPPGLSNCLDPEVLNLLHRLEAVTQIKFCRLCYYLGTNCRCAGVHAPPTSPPTSWSQIMEQTLEYGMTPSSSGVTTPSTSLGGMSGYVPPQPGISVWNMPPLEDSIPQGPVTIPPYWPPAGRAQQLRAAMRMRGLVPQAPQMPTPIHQLPLLSQSQPATPYQQLLQPPSKTSGLGVTFDSSASKPAPTDSWDTNVCGRQATRGRDEGHRPASCSRGEWEASSVRRANKPMPRQEGGQPAEAPCNAPPSSASGTKKASPGDPLKNISNYWVEEGPEPHPRVLLQIQLPHPHGGGVG